MNARARVGFVTITLVALLMVAPLRASAEAYIQGALSIAPGVITGDDRTLYGGSLAGGYYFTSWLAAQFELAGGVDTDVTDDAAIEYTIDGKFYPMELWAKDASLPVQPYAYLGLGGALVYCNDFCEDGLGGFLWKIGIGTDFKINDHFSLFAEYDYGQATIGDEEREYSRNNISFGATFRF